MPRIAMVFGVVLVILGVALYAMSEPERQSWTAFIPSIFGLVLVLLGQVAGASDRARKHAMHVAAMVALVGTVFPAFRAIRKLAEGADFNLAIGGQLAMAALCGVFLALCVKSFIDARRARKQGNPQ